MMDNKCLLQIILCFNMLLWLILTIGVLFWLVSVSFLGWKNKMFVHLFSPFYPFRTGLFLIESLVIFFLVCVLPFVIMDGWSLRPVKGMFVQWHFQGETKAFHGYLLIRCLVQKFFWNFFWHKSAMLRILKSEVEGWTFDFFDGKCVFTPLSISAP